MKSTIIVAAILSLSVLLFIQGKKEIRKNKVKSETVWNTDQAGKTVKESYEEYDINGNTILKIEYKKDGTVKHKEASKYNNLKKKIEEITYGSSDEILQKTAISYNAEGEKSNETVTDAAGKVLNKIVYKYDSKKMKLEKQTYDDSNVLQSVKKWTYEFFN